MVVDVLAGVEALGCASALREDVQAGVAEDGCFDGVGEGVPGWGFCGCRRAVTTGGGCRHCLVWWCVHGGRSFVEGQSCDLDDDVNEAPMGR